ncbi:MAG: isoleucine--tRNA ligase [Helicobacteraceae bacterium]|nr:isoleucine--tRNA ligase [Helicobacteraceae bacterium]
MRANLAENEPKRYGSWEDNDVYEVMKKKRANAAVTFTLHDGPPYANGPIHIGHALNKILKDIVFKYHYFKGESARFTPGWDCHGLPIEQQVETAVGGAEKKEQMGKAEFRSLCRDHAERFVERQKDGFMSLGIVADWKNPYITMDYKFESEIYRELCRVAKAGLIVERKKPVYWSWAAKSALAEAEVEYQDKKSDSIYVAFTLTFTASIALGLPDGKAIVIWTTTPWTLPANVAIALKADAEYLLSEEGLIVAKDRFEALRLEGVIKGEPIKSIMGADFDRLEAINPLNHRRSVFVMAEHVSMQDGTGAVHTAPGHGEEDYRISLAYDLPVLMPVDESGCFDETVYKELLLPNAKRFVGMHVFKANGAIIDLMGGAVLKQDMITHSYPYCWRTHTPVIYRATKQWFVAMDEPRLGGRTLRAVALAAIEDVAFHPESGKNRLQSMIETRPDWCISRQRDWGVPIAFMCDIETGRLILDDRILERTAQIFAEKGCDAWYSMPVEDFVASDYDPAKCEKITDILDVWFDSAATQSAVLRSGDYDAGNAPADMYLEGSDQHRGWFQSSLLASCAARGEAPYKAILTHGFTVDEHGAKMSKSKGNVVAPEEIIGNMGAEILRLWVAMSDYRAEVKISQNILNQISEQYKKLRNTFRFMLANIEDLDKPVLETDLLGADRWIVSAAKSVEDEAIAAFEANDFARAFHRINNFVVIELSGVYLEMVKDRIYCDPIDSKRRRSAQSAIFIILRSLLVLCAPVLTYTTDEIAEYAPPVLKGFGKTIFDFTFDPIGEFEPFELSAELALRERFFAQVDLLKKQGAIKNSLELAFLAAPDFAVALDMTDLADMLTISSAAVAAKAPADALAKIEGGYIIRAKGAKCPRCWKFVAAKEDEPCERCAAAIKSL